MTNTKNEGSTAGGVSVMFAGVAIIAACLAVTNDQRAEVVPVEASAVSDATWGCLRAEGLTGRPNDGPFGSEIEAVYPTRAQLNHCWFPAIKA